MHSIDIRTLPAWLKTSALYRAFEENVDADDESTYIVPIRPEFVTDKTALHNVNELIEMIHIMKFWGVSIVPEFIYMYLLYEDGNGRGNFADIVRRHARDTEFYYELHLACMLVSNHNIPRTIDILSAREYFDNEPYGCFDKLSDEALMNYFKFIGGDFRLVCDKVRDDIVTTILHGNKREHLAFIIQSDNLKKLLVPTQMNICRNMEEALRKESVDCAILLMHFHKVEPGVLIEYAICAYSKLRLFSKLFERFDADGVITEKNIRTFNLIESIERSRREDIKTYLQQNKKYGQYFIM